jgi:putative flippase GtrA
MSAKLLSGTEVGLPRLNPRHLWLEGMRYLLSSAIALAVDAGVYVGLIRLGGVHYLLSAPAGFAAGVVTIYLLSTRWVFVERRFENRRWEFAIFVVIGVMGLLLNELVIFASVEYLALTYELAKLVSAALVFGFNFSARKLLLFTRT